MRKTRYLIGALSLLGVAVAIPATANSAVSSQTIKASFTPTKLSASKKTPTSINLRVDTDTTWDSYGPAPNPTPAAISTDVDFDASGIFNPKPVKTCDLSQLSGTTSDQAIAACGPAQVGTGSATLKGIIGDLQGVVTVFNGTPSGGLPTIYLHTRVSNPPLTQVLVGTLSKSPLGKPYGMRLHVPIPAADIGGGFEVITHFDTTVGKKFTVTKKVKGKKIKVKSGYITAWCPKSKTLNVAGTFGFGTAPTFAQSSTMTATATAPCKPIPAKKKRSS
jgi:hypothetical protein